MDLNSDAKSDTIYYFIALLFVEGKLHLHATSNIFTFYISQHLTPKELVKIFNDTVKNITKLYLTKRTRFQIIITMNRRKSLTSDFSCDDRDLNHSSSVPVKEEQAQLIYHNPSLLFLTRQRLVERHQLFVYFSRKSKRIPRALLSVNLCLYSVFSLTYCTPNFSYCRRRYLISCMCVIVKFGHL